MISLQCSTCPWCVTKDAYMYIPVRKIPCLKQIPGTYCGIYLRGGYQTTHAAAKHESMVQQYKSKRWGGASSAAVAATAADSSIDACYMNAYNSIRTKVCVFLVIKLLRTVCMSLNSRVSVKHTTIVIAARVSQMQFLAPVRLSKHPPLTPGLASPRLASPSLASPSLASPRLASPRLASPRLAKRSSPNCFAWPRCSLK